MRQQTSRTHTCLVLATALLVLTPTLSFPATPATAQHGGAAVPARDARARLEEGNQRFVAGHPRHDHETTERRAALAAGQQPFAIIIGCSDSRVPPELVFDQGLGDLFVIRLAGNVLTREAAGTLEYAAAHLGTRLVVVLGHEKCGAVTAALSPKAERDKEAAALRELLEVMQPALAGVDRSLAVDTQVARGVEAMVRYEVDQLAKTAEYKQVLEGHHVTVLGAVYDVASGRVRFLNEQ